MESLLQRASRREAMARNLKRFRRVSLEIPIRHPQRAGFLDAAGFDICPKT